MTVTDVLARLDAADDELLCVVTLRAVTNDETDYKIWKFLALSLAQRLMRGTSSRD